MSQRIPRYSSPVFLMFFLSLSHSSSFFSHIYGLTQLLLASNFLCSFEWLFTYDPPAFTSAGISGVYHHVQFHVMLGTELSWEVKQGRCAPLGKHSIKCATPLAQVPPSYAGALPLSYSLHHPTLLLERCSCVGRLASSSCLSLPTCTSSPLPKPLKQKIRCSLLLSIIISIVLSKQKGVFSHNHSTMID